MIELYGIPNCNTVKKATDWLNENDLPFAFHNYKKEGVTKEKLTEWCHVFGWEHLLNKAGTTWKNYSDEMRGMITDQSSAIKLMLQNPSVIKRPIVQYNGKYLVRFNEAEYTSFFKK